MERKPPILVTLAMAAILALVATLYFLQTRDLTGSVLLAVLGIGLGLTGWVWKDAGRIGLPRIPWLFVVLLVPFVGLTAYLLAREIRRNRIEPG